MSLERAVWCQVEGMVSGAWTLFVVDDRSTGTGRWRHATIRLPSFMLPSRSTGRRVPLERVGGDSGFWRIARP